MSAKVNIRSTLNISKAVRGYESDFKRARMMVKSEIAKDCSSVIPHKDGTLQKSSAQSIKENSPYLVWNVIYAKFLYYGKVMVGSVSGRVWARKYEKKVVTDRDLKFGKGRKAFWFEIQKKKNKDKWLKVWAKGVGK